MAFTQITVTGTYRDVNDQAAQGVVWFQLSDVMRDAAANVIVARSRITAQLDGTGKFTQMLLATNDSTTEPGGVTYEVHEVIAGATNPPFRIVLDAGAALGAVDLADVARLPL